MTWSIIARDEDTGRVGIIVASRFFAVGALVPHIKTGVGAVATQALVNPLYGPQGLALLQAGASSDDTVSFLRRPDEGRAERQVHAMDRSGRFSAHTGDACQDWCGHRVRNTFSVAGNLLAGPKVLEETVATYEGERVTPFAIRLIRAMQAGEQAGGDRRGKQSAALLVHDGEDYPLLDIRVDDHPDPLTELSRLEAVSRERMLHVRRLLPNRDHPSGHTDPATREERIAASIAEGYR